MTWWRRRDSRAMKHMSLATKLGRRTHAIEERRSERGPKVESKVLVHYLCSWVSVPSTWASKATRLSDRLSSIFIDQSWLKMYRHAGPVGIKKDKPSTRKVEYHFPPGTHTQSVVCCHFPRRNPHQQLQLQRKADVATL